MMVVFDLDFTIWDAGGTWCDHTTPPYYEKNNNIFDSDHRHIKLYGQVMEILSGLKKHQIQLAVASRTHAPEIAFELMKRFNIIDYFTICEIYPSSKIAHFNKIQQKTSLPYHKMYFFDDEHRNIEDVSSIGVNCIFVKNGINKQLIEDSLGIEL